jgi:hypothetical protein
MEFGSKYAYGGKTPQTESAIPVTTNIVSVNLSRLQNQTLLATGEAVFCKNCTAVFNKFSNLEEKPDGQIWVCEFCDFANEVNLLPEEITSEAEVEYILEISSEKTKRRRIFCIDTSGSMCITTEMKGKCPEILLKHQPKEDWGDLVGIVKVNSFFASFIVSFITYYSQTPLMSGLCPVCKEFKVQSVLSSIIWRMMTHAL